MTEIDPVARQTTGKQWAVWLLRLFWPLPGAITGAAAGFHVYFRQPDLNTDTVAPLVFASLWAFAGMLTGVLCTRIVAGLIQRGVRRVFSIGPISTASLTLLCLVGLCLGLHAPLEARLPALLWPAQPKEVPPRLPAPSPCTQTPPTKLHDKKSWELECH